MNVTSTLKLYYLGKDEEYVYIVFLDSKDNFLYTVRPISEAEKVKSFKFNHDAIYAVTYSPDPIKTNPDIYELKGIANPIGTEELLF